LSEKRATSGYRSNSIWRITTMRVKDLKPGPGKYYVRPEGVRMDSQTRWWLDPEAVISEAYSRETPIQVMRGTDGYLAHEPDTTSWASKPDTGWTMCTDIKDEYPGYIQLKQPRLGKFIF
jgi:hypothetical protein